jgi:energy-coupling factor transport system permease protein
MLKDITLGQYFPGHSFVHRLDPRVKLALTFLYIVALFMAKGPIGYGVMLLFLGLSVGLSRISPRVIVRGLKPLAFILLFTAVLNLFYVPGEVLWSWKFLTLTREGAEAAAYMCVRMMMLITGTLLLTYTTSPMMLTDAMERVFSPLKRLRVPVHELAMMMTIALRFIPALIEETDKIMSAQRARGADFESGNLFKRARALIPLLVPLFVSAFRRAAELALAMESRCYHGGEGRTRMRQLRCTRPDVLALCGCVLLFAGVAVLGRL